MSDGKLAVGPVITVLYDRYRLETTTYRVTLRDIYWGSNQEYPVPQWLVDALDEAGGVVRTFALKDMRPVP